MAQHMIIAVNSTFTFATNVYKIVPFNSIIYKYIKASYQNDPLRSFMEALLVIYMVWYLLSSRYKKGANQVVLTDKEVQDLIDEWEPEPLVPPITEFQRQELDKVSSFSGPAGLKSKGVDGRDRLNFSSFNFLGLMNSEAIKDKAIQALREYGVGTCGPPGNSKDKQRFLRYLLLPRGTGK